MPHAERTSFCRKLKYWSQPVCAFGLSVLTSLGVIDRAGASTGECDGLAQLYSSCGTHFRYDGVSFTFGLSTGTKTDVCDDHRKLVYYDRMDNMDVVSVLSIPYSLGLTPSPEVRQNFDPGRLRNEDLLKSQYGASADEVRAHLVKVPFLNQTVLFNSQLGASRALFEAGQDLQKLVQANAQSALFLKPFLTARLDLRGSTFDWRPVLGTHRLSAHSFGVAIDLLTGVGPMYWLWDEMRTHPDRAKQGEQAYRNIHYVPPSAPIFDWRVVAIMEAHGFIWGGKWNHYDTMHFEYRPELTGHQRAACLDFASEPGFEKPSLADFHQAAQLQTEAHD